MSQQQAMAVRATAIWTITVSYSAAGAMLERRQGYSGATLDEQIAAALSKLEREAYVLVDIRFAVVRDSEGHDKTFATVIGRKRRQSDGEEE